MLVMGMMVTPCLSRNLYDIGEKGAQPSHQVHIAYSRNMVENYHSLVYYIAHGKSLIPVRT